MIFAIPRKNKGAGCRVFLRDIHKSEPRHRQYGRAALLPEPTPALLYNKAGKNGIDFTFGL